MFLSLLFIPALFAATGSSGLVVLEPLNAQLPPIARVNEPFSWSFSPGTFGPNNGTLYYSTSSLPAWLSFDSATLTFQGTPSTWDEGNPKIVVEAEDLSGSVSSELILCVTHYPPPTIHRPIQQQFTTSNPSLSSVFVLAPGSAIATSNPALRVPRKWSFSIGFQGDTFISNNDIYYEARMRNGSSLPQWMVFNPKAITLNGVVPNTVLESTTLALSLHGSDQEGYTAISLPFDLIVASYELSAISILPTVNVTASTPFNISLFSPADFSGVLVNNNTIQPPDIADLIINTSGYDWLKYDQKSRTLSGNPMDEVSGKPTLLPVKLTTTFNQTLETEMPLAIVASYFSSSTLPALQAAQGDPIQFSLVQYFSNITSQNDVSLSAAYEPTESSDSLKFDPVNGRLTGLVSLNFLPTHITVTFTAYSHVTHSTSHASLTIFITTLDHGKNISIHPNRLSTVAHAKLALGLGVAFGVVGGLFIFGGFLAAFRRFARVKDTAIGDEEERNVWSEQDKKWYGLGLDKVRNEKHDYGYTGPNPRFFGDALSKSAKSNESYDTHNYGNLGLGLRRVSERSQSNSGFDVNSPRNKSQSPGVMSKREFITRIREAVRNVSDKAQGRRSSSKRPIISKPILRTSHQQAGPLTDNEEHAISTSSSNPFGPSLLSHPGSTVMTNSPSTSTAEHSIPRRRADFAPPRSPPQVHFEEARLSRQISSGSTCSLASNASARTHAAEVVVQTAAKAMSVRSASGTSHRPLNPEFPVLHQARPRLVEFTSVTRVPTPRITSSPSLNSQENTHSPSKRVASQTARVWEIDSPDGGPVQNIKNNENDDELSMGLHYVQSLSLK